MTSTIVAIDDEAPNLMLIEEYLDGTGHALTCFADAADALAHLASGAPADAILVDRMMPRMDGMAFMRALKVMPGREAVPVIMQTAAAMPFQIAEGITAGAYYYLTKPYSAEVLRAVLARALTDHALSRELASRGSRFSAGTQRISRVELDVRSLGEVDEVAIFLASLYPDPQAALLGLHELMLNAVEHGNLAISYAEKTELLRAGAWQAEIARRLSLPENAAKAASVRLERGPSALVLTIEDCGAGFDCARFLQFDPARASDPHGRGIALSRMASFDDVTYIGPGNKVIGTKDIRER